VSRFSEKFETQQVMVYICFAKIYDIIKLFKCQ